MVEPPSVAGPNSIRWETPPCSAKEQIGCLSGDEKSSLVGRHREANVFLKREFRFAILHLIPWD